MVIFSMKNHPKIHNHGSMALAVSSITSNPPPVWRLHTHSTIFVCWALEHRGCHLFAADYIKFYYHWSSGFGKSYISTCARCFFWNFGSKLFVQKHRWFHTQDPHFCGSICTMFDPQGCPVSNLEIPAFFRYPGQHSMGLLNTWYVFLQAKRGYGSKFKVPVSTPNMFILPTELGMFTMNQTAATNEMCFSHLMAQKKWDWWQSGFDLSQMIKKDVIRLIAKNVHVASRIGYAAIQNSNS